MSVNLLLFKKSNRNSIGRFFVMVTAIMLGIAIVLSYTAGTMLFIKWLITKE